MTRRIQAMTTTDFTKGFELALDQANHRFPHLTQIRAKADSGHHLQFAAPEINAPSFFLLDVTISDGKVRLIESNGSNGALSSTIKAGDATRAKHMAYAFATKPRAARQVVTLLSHQAGFLHLGEFFVRAELFTAELSRNNCTRLRGVGEMLGEEEVTVVCGSTAEIAAELRKEGERLFYKDRPVAFASNPNVLPELVRRGTIRFNDGRHNIDLRIFHEGGSTPVVHDKGLQQELARGTGIEPLAWRLVENRAGWKDAIEWFQNQNIPCVAKMHAGSGGTGIELITPGMTAEECEDVLDLLISSACKTYGTLAPQTIYPITLFEFAQADPVIVDGSPHLWDLRVMALAYPGRVECFACVGRLCPAPFDGSWKRDTWVSNLTGRDGNQAELFLRSPTELGLSGTDLNRILESCARWTVAATRWGEQLTN
jgi:hypothetical protein